MVSLGRFKDLGYKRARILEGGATAARVITVFTWIYVFLVACSQFYTYLCVQFFVSIVIFCVYCAARDVLFECIVTVWFGVFVQVF